MSYLLFMTTVAHIVTTIGRKKLATAVGVGETAVFNAIKRGIFPAQWFEVVEFEALRHGIECPRDIFSFIAPPKAAHPAPETEGAT